MIPVELNAEIGLPSGDRIRWDAQSPDAGNRPISPSFDTETGRGFATGSVTLTRPTARDYPELGLLNELILRTGTGQIVYQGRAQGIPVGDAFTVDCDGWMSHGEQREITDLIIDRDASSWGEPSTGLRTSYQVANGWSYGSNYSVSSDKGEIVFEGTTGSSIPANSLVVSVYRAPAGVTIGRFGYAGSQRNTTGVDTARVRWNTIASPDTFTASSTLTLDDTFRTVNIDGANRALLIAQASSTHTPAGTAQFSRRIKPAVYGTSGIPTYSRGDNLDGFYASDAIRYLASRYCSKWNTDGVENTTYPIPHAVWRDPVTPADAMRQMNSYHLWRFGVWENRRLEFAPYDLSVADWQVASGVDGVRVDYQGDTTENVFNGVAVTFTAFDGERYRLTPDDSEDLRDRSEWIAANLWSDEAWLNIDVSWPVAAEDAIEIGRLALANANLARRPSTITVPATIRDIHGNVWPSSYVRSDQTIVVTNQHTPIPRLITRTSWADHSLTITTDNAIDTVEAFTTRLSGALSASGVL